jgi:hypothetical protein
MNGQFYIDESELQAILNGEDDVELLLEKTFQPTKYTGKMRKSQLLGNTDVRRKWRARNQVRTKPPSVVIFEDRVEMLEYNVKAYPSTEKKRHWGYIIYDPKTKEIKQLYCSCKDFAYRLFKPMEKAGMLIHKQIPAKYIIHASVIPTKAWTVKTNPEGKLFVCKHICSILLKYI